MFNWFKPKPLDHDTNVTIAGVAIVARKCLVPKALNNIGTLIQRVRNLTGLNDIGPLTIEVLYAPTDFVKTGLYEPYLNTIYVVQDCCSDSVLSHELTHCMIYNYFKKQLPKQCAEVIPQWTDLNLR